MTEDIFPELYYVVKVVSRYLENIEKRGWVMKSNDRINVLNTLL